MPRFRKENTEELLKKMESTDSPGEETSTRVAGGKARGKKESIQNQNYRKKKKDALEGKEEKQLRNSESESEGRGRGTSDRDSSDKGSKSTGTGGPQSQSSLQSGQTTVQFSSGGGFGSLLALFASSASLVRAEISSILTVSTQTTNLNLQNILRTINNQSGNLLNEEGKNLREVTRATEYVSESSGKQFNLEIGSVQVAQRSTSADVFSAILKGVSAQAGEGGGNSIDFSKITIFSIPYAFTIYEGFNTSTFFFSNTTIFTFPNSPVTTTPVFGSDGTTVVGFALSNVNLQTVDSYFKDAGLSPSNSYIYKVLGPIVSPTTTTLPDGGGTVTSPTLQPISQPYGVTIVKDGDLSVGIAAAPQTVMDKIKGITLTPTGDIYANVLNPTSVLVNAQTASGDLTVRINAGPGKILESANAANDAMLGLKTTDPTHPNEFASSVFRSSGSNTIVGNAYALSLSGSTLSYIGGFSNTQSSFDIPENYTLPSSTIFRHVGTSNETVPTQAAYGNFASLVNPSNPSDIIYSTITFADGVSHKLTFGENVLDVFGTKYGEGDVLNINLATTPSAANTITMGGNTLAGFGTAYGDLKTLSVSALIAPHNSSFSTTLTFKGNILWVDKNVDSTLYSHLKDLNLSDHLTANSNLKVVFGDSIIHGNLGADTFYGDIQNLGDLAIKTKYNDFIKGVVVTEVDGHVVVTPRGPVFVDAVTTTDAQGNVVTIPAHYETVLSTNSITWGNDVYSGGVDPDNPSEQNINTYNFTLLGTDDPLPRPVMQGHDLITDFNLEKDTLKFQLTPELFKALDTDHNKVISVDDLNSGITPYNQEVGQLFNKAGHFYDPLLYRDVDGTVITFRGGGSLSLEGVFADDFNDIKNLVTEVNITYVPVANLAPDEIVATTPILTAPYIYGQGPTNQIHSYSNELDNFFANSLFAHYTVEGLPTGVTIDEYGTITVDTLVPYLVPLTITATDDHGSSVTSNPLLFGFLNAPIIAKLDAPLVMPGIGDSASNILIGGLNATIIGSPQSDFNLTVQGAIDTTPPDATDPKFIFGSNLIVDAAKSTTAEAYGNFKTILLKAQGGDSVTASTDASILGSINHDTFNFKPNAFYVNGTVFGVATSLQIEARGGNDAVVNFDTDQDIQVDDTASFDNNTINIGSQVIYGDGTGILTGNFNQIIMNSIPGTPKTEVVLETHHSSGINIQNGFNLPAGIDIDSLTGSIDTSSSIQHNTFTFGPTQITIQGDSAGQISTINANVHDLIITVQNAFPKNISPNLTNITAARFADNHFIFNDATLKGDQGGVNFFGHLYNFGDAFDYTQYRGFVKGITVTNDNSHLTITTEKNNNSITWGNNIYTGGEGADTYNFAIVEDVNHFAVMQGFDTITNFNPHVDTIVFNLERNLFRYLGMNDSDDQFTRAEKLDQQVNISSDGQSGSLVSFTGPLNSAVSFGHIDLDNIGLWTSLSQINNYYSSNFGITPIQIISIGPDYTPPTANPDALSTFDPVFVKVDQVQAFVSFVANADLESLTWGLANGIVLPPEFSFTADGTLHVFESSDGKTPVDAFIQVTVHDEVDPTNIITIPSIPIHIFALNPDSGTVFRDAAIKGTKATEVYETSGATKIVGGGDNITYNPTTSPTVPGSPLIYGSKLIYDISEGGHTAIGDVEKIEFTNTATTITTPAVTIPATGTTPAITTHAISNLDGQTITFNANMFNINSGGVGAILGNITSLKLSANARNDGQGGLIDATINNNIFNFGPNTIYTVGSTTPLNLGNSFIAYGIMQTLSLLIDNPEPAVTGVIGNAYISGNQFNFSANKLIGSSDAMTLNPGLGVLNIVNKDTYAHDPLTPNPNPISGNILTFANSALTSGTGETFFNADIADLSNSDFVTGIVTFRNDTALPVQVTDSHNNVITWGNNTYTILPTNQSSTLTFTLLSLGGNDGNDAAMQGHAIINGFRLDTDTLDLKLSPLLFKALNTDYDRSISLQELNIPSFTQFDSITSPGNTILSFAPSLAAGSIKFMGQTIGDYTNFSHLITELAYTPAPIIVHNPALGLTPQIFLTSGGNGAGVYGNVLDSYFDHIDIGNEGSTYTVTLDAAYPQLIDPATLLSTDGVGTLFDQYGTAKVANTQSPTLGIINAKPTDVHNPTNDVNIDLMVGTFNGTMTVDPNTAPGGTFMGSLGAPSYLQGSFTNETLIGNSDSLTVTVQDDNIVDFGIDYGTNTFGGNMIINTNMDNKAYGDFRNALFSIEATNTQTGFASLIYNFGSNAFDVNGTIFGIADKLLVEVKNSVAGDFSIGGTENISATFGDPSFSSLYNFGPQTIFGQGTLTGDLNALQFNVFGNTTANITGGFEAHIDVSANIDNNIFSFAPTEIVALGSEVSTIFTHVNSLSFFAQQGAEFIAPLFPFLTQTLDTSANIKNNIITFQDSIAVGGSGGINYYSDINDLSGTSFWSSDSVFFSDDGLHISTIDNMNSSDQVSNNTINWGSNKVYLSAESGSHDTIHLNLLEDQNHDIGLTGNLDVYNFNPADDAIHFNLSAALYKAINGNSTTLNGAITAATLSNTPGYSFSIAGTPDKVINFDYGYLFLHGVMGLAAFASIPNIQFGTTLVGTMDSDAFTIDMPTVFSNFKEVDHIAQFNPNEDALRFSLSPTAYAQMSQYGLISGTDLLNTIESSAGTPTGGITITQKPIEYESADPTNSGAVVDSTLNFVTNNIISGSITLHNVDITTLDSPFVQIGQQGTAASDTFNYVTGNDFSTFTDNTFIAGFDMAKDYIEITVPKTLYNSITNNGSLSAAAALSANVANGTGGIIVAESGSNTVLQFETNNVVHGTITIDGINTTLSGLGSHLHLGYIDSGTLGVDTFAFNLSQGSFGTFHQFAHITNFDSTQDILQITVPVGLYYTINTEGAFSGQSLYDKLAVAATTATGGITTASETAHYPSPQYGTGSSDFVLDFQNLGGPPSGIITLHNVDGATSLASLGNHFQFGSMQYATDGIDTFAFNTPANAPSNFSAFQQFDHILGFDLSQDFLNITLPVGLFNTISSNGTKDSAQIALDLKNNSSPTLGDINLISENGSTSLKFVDSSNNLYGSITLDSFAFTPAPPPAAPP